MGLEHLRSVFQDQLADIVNDFVSQTPTHFNSSSPIFDSLNTTSVINISTDTNSEP